MSDSWWLMLRKLEAARRDTMPGVANTLRKLDTVPGLAGTIRELEAAGPMPGLAGTIRELEAATASALTRNADPGPSSPDLVVPVVPVDPAVALQTDTAESHVTHQPAQSSRPPLPLAIHEYLVEIEGRAKRLLEGCHTPGGGIGSFDEVRATEILRSYAVDALDKQAEYYESQKAFSPQWLNEVVDRTVAATLDLSDPINRVYRALLQSQTIATLNPVDGIPESWPLRNEAEWWRRMLQVRIEQRLNLTRNRAEAGRTDQASIQICPNEASAATSDLPNPERSGGLPARTDRTVAEESRSGASPPEAGITLPRRGYFIQGIATGQIRPSLIDGIQSWVEEADCRTLVKLCKAIDPALEEVDVRECVETYILERFDNVAVGFLEIVTGAQTIDEYMAILKEWCDSVLPALERGFMVDKAAVRRLVYEATVPRLVDEATFRRIEEEIGTTGRIIGSVDMRKLAERAAQWKAKAISRARGIETGLSRIHSKRLQGAKTRDCLRAAYDLYPSGLDVLTEEFLSRAVPGLVFGAAVDHKWVRYPPIRPTGETISQNELTETFGDYRVPSGYGASFTRNLESRIAHWRAVERTRAAASDQSQLERAGGKAPLAIETEAAKPQPATVSPQIVGKKKLGRPQTIPDQKKAEALKRKDGGRSNRDAAVIIYSTNYPTQQQVRNVSTILRIYRAKTKKAHSPGLKNLSS